MMVVGINGGTTPRQVGQDRDALVFERELPALGVWLDGASARATLELVRKGACYESSLDLASEQRLRVPPSTFITNQALKVA